LSELVDGESLWKYSIGIRQETRGYRQPILEYERVWKNGCQILDRPNDNNEDSNDPERLKQTFLEQVNTNSEFRDIARYLQSVTYLHLVPQLLRYANSFKGYTLEDDPFGQGFLERVAKALPRTQKSRLSKIEKALKIAVPQLQQLKGTSN